MEMGLSWCVCLGKSTDKKYVMQFIHSFCFTAASKGILVQYYDRMYH